MLDAEGTPGPARSLGAGQRPSTAALPTGVGVVYEQVSGSDSDLFAQSQCLVP